MKRRRKPSGWRRLKEEEILQYLPPYLQSYDKLMAWIKEDRIIGIGRYYCKGISKSNYGYNVFSYNLANKQGKILDEVYNQNWAIRLGYLYMNNKSKKKEKK